MSEMKTQNATITLENGGEIKLELYPDIAPVTVENFVKLANEGFYDGLSYSLNNGNCICPSLK